MNTFIPNISPDVAERWGHISGPSTEKCFYCLSWSQKWVFDFGALEGRWESRENTIRTPVAGSAVLCFRNCSTPEPPCTPSGPLSQSSSRLWARPPSLSSQNFLRRMESKWVERWSLCHLHSDKLTPAGCGLCGPHGGSAPRDHSPGRRQAKPPSDGGGGQLVHGGHLSRPLPPAGGPHDHKRLCQHLLRVALCSAAPAQDLRSQACHRGSEPLREENYHALQPSLCTQERRR